MDVQLAHEDRVVVSSKLFAIQLNIPQPVVLRGCIGKRVIDEIVASQIIVEQQLLHGKIVRAGELDDIHTGQIQLVQRFFKLPVFILPENDPALIELRQWGSETLFEVELYGFCGQGISSPFQRIL